MRGLRPGDLLLLLSSPLYFVVAFLDCDGDGDVYLIVRDIVIEKSTLLSMFPSPRSHDVQELTLHLPPNQHTHPHSHLNTTT
jgi:hypothetical protein